MFLLFLAGDKTDFVSTSFTSIKRNKEYLITISYEELRKSYFCLLVNFSLKKRSFISKIKTSEKKI